MQRSILAWEAESVLPFSAIYGDKEKATGGGIISSTWQTMYFYIIKQPFSTIFPTIVFPIVLQ
jgi:uncharacterized protein YceK